MRPGLEIFDRVGGGDSFASGLIYGLLEGLGPARAIELGAAHGALAMTTPGDTSMATLAEVERLAVGRQRARLPLAPVPYQRPRWTTSSNGRRSGRWSGASARSSDSRAT